MDRRFRSFFSLCLATFFGTLVWSGAQAQQTEFLGEQIDVAPGTYLVNKDVNIREKPRTNSKRLGQLKEGEIITVAGQATNTVWFAFLKDGNPFGFVYGTVLSPLLDGQIDDDVTGEVRVSEGHRCGFRIAFIGRTGIVDDGVRTSDYDASIVCERNATRIRFPAQMFLTEVPFDGSRKRRVFQVNVDLLDGVHALDDIYSTILLYDLDDGEVRFDTVTDDTYARESGGFKALPATNVPAALAAALEIALIQWSDRLWDDIYARAN